MGYAPLGTQVGQYTVPAVLDEVRDRSARIRINTAIDLGVLRVVQPTEESRLKVIEQSTQLGDIGQVSTTDIDVLALTLDLLSSGRRCFLVTDDYSVQNIAHQMEIPYRPLSTRGIKYQFLWRLYCPACGRSYPSNLREKECPVCGTPRRRRVTRKSRVNGS